MALNPAEYPTAAAEAERSDGPIRRCAITGERRDKAALIRFALDPAGQAIPDIDESLPGRGFWVSARPGLLAGRLARKRLGRLLGGQALPEDIDRRLEQLLLARCVDIIGLARRAGQAVAGWEKVRRDSADRPIGLLLTARDAGIDGWRRARALDAGADRHVTCLVGAELGRPFGRGMAVHVVLRQGRLADRLARDGARLAAFRPAPGDVDPAGERTAGERTAGERTAGERTGGSRDSRRADRKQTVSTRRHPASHDRETAAGQVAEADPAR